MIDVPARQGHWVDRQFIPGAERDQIESGALELYFNNLMEYENGTHPLDDDSDDDSIINVTSI